MLCYVMLCYVKIQKFPWVILRHESKKKRYTKWVTAYDPSKENTERKKRIFVSMLTVIWFVVAGGSQQLHVWVVVCQPMILINHAPP